MSTFALVLAVQCLVGLSEQWIAGTVAVRLFAVVGTPFVAAGLLEAIGPIVAIEREMSSELHLLAMHRGRIAYTSKSGTVRTSPMRSQAMEEHRSDCISQ